MKRSPARRSLRKTAGRYHHGDLREALIAATLAIVRGAGPEAVTLRAVAGKAGVSEAAPYHHFRDKTELLAAAAAVSFERLRERLQVTIDNSPGLPREALVSLGVEWVRFALDEPGSFRLIFGAHVDALARFEETRLAGSKTKALVREAIGTWARARGEADEETVFRALWAQVHGTAWLSLEKEFGPGFDRAAALELARTGLERLLDGFEKSRPLSVAPSP